MKKTSIALMVAGIISITNLMAQTIQDGINHLYADRDQSAKGVFDKLIAANPNNLDAIYWLGQTYIEMGDIKSAGDLYDKALATNGNAPLILVGRGQVDLANNKTNEARQRFEAAITASKTKKGDDPNILNAIGRANIHEKAGDIAYAIDKLKIAADRDPKNADIFLNLGDAYRKTHDGGLAVTNYDKAIAVNPAFARAEYRKAKIYETQKNWEVFLDNLSKTTSMDPKFAPAYYDLYYYYLYRQKYDEADGFAKKYIENSDADVQTNYLRAQTLWAKKDYDGAIGILKDIVAKAGDKAKPRTYKLLAYAYADKGDTASAKDYVDQYFAKATDEEIIAQDWILKGAIYGTLTKDDNIVLQSLEKAVSLDTVYSSKWDLLQSSYDVAKTKGNKCLQGAIGLLMYKTRKIPYQYDLFNSGLSYYQCGSYTKADSVFQLYNTAYPDSIYGYYWSALTNLALDTTLSAEPYLSQMVNGFKKTLDLAGGNKDLYKAQAIRSSLYLAGIYNNTKKDRDSALYFVNKGLEFDNANPNLNGIKAALEKKAGPSKPAKSNSGGSKPSAFIKQEADNKSATAAKK
ncbi:MAG: tetratricopeptide repeat protein [Bacteroidetes bacterium]|nr:tetratricopeptide repeat protein [Bacteroidota bacterium]MBS1607718.1 tetratricopeptide repeat protein [Bacteroidota bacterium]